MGAALRAGSGDRRPFDHARRHEPRGRGRDAGGLPVPFREDADLDPAARRSAQSGDVLGGRLHAGRRATAVRASRSSRHARTCGGSRRTCPRSSRGRCPRAGTPTSASCRCRTTWWTTCGRGCSCCWASSALVLLIACANVANLTLARAASRAKEISVRSALGAGRPRIARQLLTESVVLALAGGLLGLVVAVQGLALLKRILPPETPRMADVQIDWRVLAFTAVARGRDGPGLRSRPRASRVADGPHGLAEEPAGGARRSSVSQRLRSALVVGEIAFAVLLVIAAGLLVRSFWALSHVNAGFRPEHVMTARITPSQPFCSDGARCLAFYRQVLDRIRASPGVSGAALVNTLPLDGRVAKRSLNLEGRTVPEAENAPAVLAQRRHAGVLSRHEHPGVGRPGVHGRGSLGQPAGGDRPESDGAAVLDGGHGGRQADQVRRREPLAHRRRRRRRRARARPPAGRAGLHRRRRVRAVWPKGHARGWPDTGGDDHRGRDDHRRPALRSGAPPGHRGSEPGDSGQRRADDAARPSPAPSRPRRP